MYSVLLRTLWYSRVIQGTLGYGTADLIQREEQIDLHHKWDSLINPRRKVFFWKRAARRGAGAGVDQCEVRA